MTLGIMSYKINNIEIQDLHYNLLKFKFILKKISTFFVKL